MSGIFISYRRDDAPGVAGRLFDRLSRDFDQSELFMDVDTMKPGIDFVKQIDDQVSKCDVMIAIIGPDWLNAEDDKGRRKLDLPRDFVRLEVASALKRDIPVIPVLVNGTAMPSEDDLPDDLKTLPHRHALELRHTRFSADSETVIRALRQILPRRRHLRWLAGAAAVLAIGAVVGLGATLWHFSALNSAMPADARRDNQAAVITASPKPTPAASIASPTPTAAPTEAPRLEPQRPTRTDFPIPAFNGRKVALVIGNSKYPDANAPLASPINDAKDLSNELKRSGFDVDYAENLTTSTMKSALERFYSRIERGSAALLFFSGFGVQSSRQSYLIPVDAQIWTESDVRRDGFSLESILERARDRGAAIKIALIDASRRNPFERRFRSFSGGLAPVIAPSGSLVMYSASPSSVVNDESSDRGLFVTELVKELRSPDLIAEEALNRTRVGVMRASRGDQVPWISSSLAADFTFSPKSAAR